MMVHAMMIDSCNACTLYKIVQVLLLNVHSKIIDCFRTLVDTSYMYYSATTIKPHQHEVFGYKNTPREYKYYCTVIYVVTSDVRLFITCTHGIKECCVQWHSQGTADGQTQ